MVATKTRAKPRKTAKPAAPAPSIENWEELLNIAITVPGAMGNTYSRFHRYSVLNMALLMSQGIMEPCASYERWKAMGRQVQKGTHAALINRPIIIKREVEGSEDPATFKRFKLVKGAHPYSNTEGAELPPYVPPTWDRSKALAELGIRQVDYQKIDGNSQGYSFAKSFAINPVAVYPFKTLMHELGHIVLGHTVEVPTEETHRGIREFQAEAVAHIVLNELEATDQFNPSESRAYIQGWLNGETPSKQQIAAVFSAADKILRAGFPDQSGV
ncbi:ImmA/IrrE family metallo-endopeptidase [Nocardia abscessus]|uniref:ImmA/IrrE family metallo-endopeptidase n=1 Tax=Nocardia abscessus TaxID=120957 RepID=UPI0024583126|nr:hypothetical protein [Nocardia abscessus]